MATALPNSPSHPPMVDEATARRQMEELIRNSKPRSVLEVLLQHAEAYNRGALACIEKAQVTGNADLAAPAIMCQAFSIELLLKFFVVLPHPGVMRYSELHNLGVELRGHRFSTLFDRIASPVQDAIASTFSTQSGEPTSSAGFRAKLIELGDEPFIEWRYVYEKEGIQHLHYALFNQVVDALGLTALTALNVLESP